MKVRKNFSLRSINTASSRKNALEKLLKIKLSNIGNFGFREEEVTGRNIENLIGKIDIPLGVAGPLLLNGKTYFIPLATTEGALVASVSRGCKAITESKNCTVYTENLGVTRGPVLKTRDLKHAVAVKQWIEKNFRTLKTSCESTSTHLELKKLECKILGKNIFLRFYFDTDKAMGMNMATIATEEAVNTIEQHTGAKCTSLAGNFDIDKKPAWLNFLQGRGRQIWASCTIKKSIIKNVLKTDAETIEEVVRQKCHLGSIMAGSLGFNAHFANIVAAIFLATGQDIAHIVEASLGVTTAESSKNGSLHFSIYLPSLLLGTIGGGTHLPTQRNSYEIMGLKNGGDPNTFAQIVAGAVLAGELSLIASLAEGSLANAHRRHGRKGK